MKHSGLLKILICISLALLVCQFFWHAFGPSFVTLFRLIRAGDEPGIEAFLREEDPVSGIIATFILCVIQVCSIVVPSMPIHIAAGIVYGGLRAFIICYSAFVFANAGIFWVTRQLRRRFGIELRSRAARTLRGRLNAADPVFVVAISNMVPGVPNGIIPYVASGADIRFTSYVKAIASVCWIQILCNCMIGSLLIAGKFLYMGFVIGGQMLLAALVYFNRERFYRQGR